MLIHRYLRKELLKTFVAVCSVLLLIAISHKFVRLMGQAALGELSPTLLFQVIGLQIPELLSILLPLSLYLSILLSFGRLYVDNELPAMFACGFRWAPLVKLCLGFGFWVMVVVGTLTLYIVPKLAEIRDILMAQDVNHLLVKTVSPGRFHTLNDDKFVFYVEALSADREHMQEVFIAEQPSGEPNANENWRVLLAQKGQILTSPETGDITVTLQDGARYEGTPGQQDYSVVSFEQYGKLLEKKPVKEVLYYHRSMPTTMLWTLPNKSYMAEFFWRVSVPLSVMVLVVLGVALSRVPPRLGRFAKILPAIILYVIYYNFLTLSKRWVASEVLSSWLEGFWVHGVVLGVALLLLGQASGRWHQFKAYLKSMVSFSRVGGV